MSEILTPQNIVELAKMVSVALGSVIIGWYAIKTQAERSADALDKQFKITLKAFETNNNTETTLRENTTAITDLRIVIEKLCEKLNAST